MTNDKNRTKTLLLASMLTALVFVVTFLIPPIPITGKGAYINLGDSVIYCTGLLVSPLWAAAASGVGSAISDLAYGASVYAPATFIIKALMGLVCATLIKRGKFPMFMMSSVIGGAIMVAGYALFEMLFLGGWGYTATTIVGNLIQWVAGVAAAAVLYYPVKRVRGAL